MVQQVSLFYGALPLLLLLCWALLAPDAHSRTLAEDIKGHTSFAFNLLEACCKLGDPNNKNIVISPVSVFIAMAMVGLGSDGKTESEFKLVLGDSFVNDAQEQSEKLEGMGSQILLANAIFQTGNIKEGFRKDLEKFFKAESRNDMNMAAINSWCSKKTKEMVKQVLKDELDDSTTAVVVNAIYLKATWKHTFDIEHTKPGLFNEQHHVNYMEQTEWMHYFKSEDSNIEAVVLPYDKNLEMVVVLPGQNSLWNDVLSRVPDILKKRWKQVKVTLTLPRMKLSYEIDLAGALYGLGLVDAFTERAASFKKMSDIQFHISKVIHKVVMEVDEYGTEAAAATAAVGDFRCISNSICATMTVDRPFFLIVRTTTSKKIIVFEALVNNPME